MVSSEQGIAAPQGTPGPRVAIGIDVGGTGTKGALVDVSTGQLLSDRIRFDTPQPATPEAIAATVQTIVDSLAAPDEAPIGVAIPAVVTHGTARTAANIDPAWIDCDVDALFSTHLGRAVHVLNDADAAGVAEERFGAARNEDGLVCLITLGTGIGSALIMNGVLVPNTEFGHLELDGHIAEQWAATSVRTRQDLSWKQWSARLQQFFTHVERIISPDLFVIGGGISKNAEKFVPRLDLRTPIVVAEHRNNAGIIGAAALADAQ